MPWDDIEIQGVKVTAFDKHGHTHLVITLSREPLEDERVFLEHFKQTSAVDRQSGESVSVTGSLQGAALTLACEASEVDQLDLAVREVEKAVEQMQKLRQDDRFREAKAKQLDTELQKAIRYRHERWRMRDQSRRSTLEKIPEQQDVMDEAKSVTG